MPPKNAIRMGIVHNSSIPETPVRIHVPSTAYQVISLNGQLVQGEEIFQTIPE